MPIKYLVALATLLAGQLLLAPALAGDVIRVRQIILVDSEGQEVGLLGELPGGGTGFRLTTLGGSQEVTIYVRDTSAGFSAVARKLHASTPAEYATLNFFVVPEGAQLTLDTNRRGQDGEWESSSITAMARDGKTNISASIAGIEAFRLPD